MFKLVDMFNIIIIKKRHIMLEHFNHTAHLSASVWAVLRLESKNIVCMYRRHWIISENLFMTSPEWEKKHKNTEEKLKKNKMHGRIAWNVLLMPDYQKFILYFDILEKNMSKDSKENFCSFFTGRKLRIHWVCDPDSDRCQSMTIQTSRQFATDSCCFFVLFFFTCKDALSHKHTAVIFSFCHKRRSWL